ncbi:hypothetical protein [Parvularcula marina]|nr:hypothetical protein [Parvularcula marina]
MFRMRPLPLVPSVLAPMAFGLISLISGSDADASEQHASSSHHVVTTGSGSNFHFISTSSAVHENEIEMVFLSDPFAELPKPPKPHHEKRKAKKKAPKPPEPPTRGGDDEAFEKSMEKFERSMEEFEKEMEDFGEEMEAFGEAMGEWGEKMGAVGETMGEISEDCIDHIEDSDAPTVLTGRVEDTGQVVKAVCASGGKERYMSDELERFVLRHPDLTDEEKDYFMDHRDDPSTVHMD